MTAMTEDDDQLLRQFVRDRSRGAFEQLVRRYVGIVHGAALRQVRDPHLAEDVTQAVFIVLVNKAAKLQNMKTIGGWLLKVTRYAAIDAMRKQNLIRRHEQLASQQRPEQVGAAEPKTDEWEQLAPVLDDAMSRLGATDRDAVVLRYFQEESYADIAQKLSVGEDAARKRVDRALAKLRGILSRKGVTLPAAAVAAGVAAHASAAVPSALVTTIVSGATVASASAATGLGLSIAKGAINMMAWANAKVAAVAFAALLLAASGGVAVVHLALAPQVQNQPAPDATGGDRKAILGTWYITGTTRPFIELVLYSRIDFGEGQMTLVRLPPKPGWKTDVDVTYNIDPVPDRKWIDITSSSGRQYLGVYEIDGDILRICCTMTESGWRPKQIADAPNLTLISLSRKPPATMPVVFPQAPATNPDTRQTGLEGLLRQTASSVSRIGDAVNQQTMLGMWYLGQTYINNVTPIDEVGRHRFFFTGKELIDVDNPKATTRPYTIDPQRDPKWIDLTSLDGTTVPGIYQSYLGGLMIYLPREGVTTRPTSTDEPDLTMLSFSRTPPSEMWKSRIIAVRADLANFQAGLEAYKKDNGQYPSDAQGLRSLIARACGNAQLARPLHSRRAAARFVGQSVSLQVSREEQQRRLRSLVQRSRWRRRHRRRHRELVKLARRK